jgi:hypothetical protein
MVASAGVSPNAGALPLDGIEALRLAPPLEDDNGVLGFPRFDGHRSGICRGECTGRNELLLVIDRAEVVQR